MKKSIGAMTFSRKLLVFLVAVLVVVANEAIGQPLSYTAVFIVAFLAVGWMLAQGQADKGAQGAAMATKRALKEGGEVADAVISVLANGTLFEGPFWGDETKEDPKQLNG